MRHKPASDNMYEAASDNGMRPGCEWSDNGYTGQWYSVSISVSVSVSKSCFSMSPQRLTSRMWFRIPGSPSFLSRALKKIRELKDRPSHKNGTSTHISDRNESKKFTTITKIIVKYRLLRRHLGILARNYLHYSSIILGCNDNYLVCNLYWGGEDGVNWYHTTDYGAT